MSRANVVLGIQRWYKSIWFFPVALAIPLIILCIFHISGSSLGIYNEVFYGAQKDPNLLLNKPRAIRSDEWAVNSQAIIGQKENNYSRINQNIGNGEDMSFIIDVPYKEWSVIFKPHNLAFFALPFDVAFAARWWMMAYLLIVSCYFFVLALMPGKRLLGSLLGVAIFFSPFVQWWYLPGTLGVLYYSLFASTIIVKIMNEKRRKYNLFWAAGLAYVLTCMAMLFYPPFQIPCALVLGAFMIGYGIEKLWKAPRAVILEKLSILGIAFMVAGLITVAFLATRQPVVQAITNTAYPGKRIVSSGGYDVNHFLSSHLSHQFQSNAKAAAYVVPKTSLANQSENSNFILLIPFLFIPGMFLLVRQYVKEKKLDWPLLSLSLLFVALLVRLFVPHTDIFFKALLLQVVPQNRLIIGFGLLNILYVVLIMRHLSKLKKFRAPKYSIFAYVLIVFAINVALGIYARDHFPGFIHTTKAWLFAIPIPVIIYLLLTKRNSLAIVGLLAFSAFSTAHVNPLYRGTSVLTDTPLSKTIQTIAQKDDGVWVSEVGFLQNFPSMNGARSLTGVYTYPQLSIWKGLGAPQNTYNRYAHTSAALDRHPDEVIPSHLALIGGDSFVLVTEPCSSFLQTKHVSYLLAGMALDTTASCATLVTKVVYPTQTFYIYKLKF